MSSDGGFVHLKECWPGERSTDDEMRGLCAVQRLDSRNGSSTTHPGGLAFPGSGAHGPLRQLAFGLLLQQES